MAHVLVVDDSATFRRMLCPTLRAAGHFVSEAVDGEEALIAIEESAEPLVVILDVFMPRLGGIGVLNAIDDAPHLAVRNTFILVTATPHAVPPYAVADMLVRLNVPILVKPFEMSRLLDLISRARPAPARRQAERTFSHLSASLGRSRRPYVQVAARTYRYLPAR